MEAQICFLFAHHDYNYKFVNRFTYIRFDSSLNLKQEPFFEFIPEFIRKNEPSNWLREDTIDQINLSKIIRKSLSTTKLLEFDKNTQKNKWIVYNTFYKETCISDVEVIEIDPVSGEVLSHREEKQIVLHCH